MKNMKKETEFNHKAKSQKLRSIGNVSSEVDQLNNHWKLNDAYSNAAAVGTILSGNAGWTSDSLCKGPPGRPRARGHPPEHITVSRSSPLSVYREEQGVSKKNHSITTTNFNKQNTNDKQILFFKNLLIFKIMKKQILFLAFLLAAVFAGTNAFGQTPTTDTDFLDAVPTYCAPYVALTCGQGDGLTPLPGVEYTYTIGSSSIGSLHWFVTDDASIISAQGTIAAGIEAADGSSPYILSADGAYNVITNTTPEVKITWKAFDGATNNVLLVVYNVDAANCTDNMEVYRIAPKYSFTLDIAAIEEDGANGGPGTEECVNPIQTASYDGTTQTLTVDYGSNYVFFAVNAANWMTSWMPDNFTAVSDIAGSTVTVDGWAYPADAATTGAWNTVGTDDVLASAYPVGISDNGFVAEACIIVRVKVDHTTVVENITANETITLTVNGEMTNPDGTSGYDGNFPDLDEPATVGDPCTDDLTTDAADYLITPRPAVTATDPVPFETKAPTGN